MTKSVFKIIAIFIVGIVGGIFAEQILWPYFVEKPLFFEYRLEQSPVYITEEKEITIQENTALQEAIEKVNKVVVMIRTKTKAGEVLQGSGLIVTSDGLVVSLAQFFPEGSEATLFFDGKILVPKIVQIKNGLVLLRIEENNLPTVGFANFREIRLGQRVFLIGAVPYKVSSQKLVNEGIVKSFDQDLIKTNIFEEDNLEGSTLFDIEGSVLGLNVVDQKGQVAAIPISQIKEFLGYE